MLDGNLFACQLDHFDNYFLNKFEKIFKKNLVDIFLNLLIDFVTINVI